MAAKTKSLCKLVEPIGINELRYLGIDAMQYALVTRQQASRTRQSALRQPMLPTSNAQVSEFGIASAKYEEFRQLYPLVASEVSRRGGGRAMKFYARFSFCRGMWMTLSFLLGIYIVIYSFDVPGITHTPLFLTLSPTHQFYGLIGMVFSILVFLQTSGEYKGYYVDYLITEFFAQYGRKGSS